MQGRRAMAAGVREAQVAVASTGVIGVPLPMDGMMRGILAARGAARADGDGAFWRAIATTDASRSGWRSTSRCRPARCGSARRPRAPG
jgi:glutamate N-acetyltransferase/amino-acid N-acetyltransferase